MIIIYCMQHYMQKHLAVRTLDSSNGNKVIIVMNLTSLFILFEFIKFGKFAGNSVCVESQGPICDVILPEGAYFFYFFFSIIQNQFLAYWIWFNELM